MKVITASFATYCEAGDDSINPGDEIEKFEGSWSHHTCAETLREEYREAEREEREEARQVRKDSLADPEPSNVLDSVIEYASEIWPGCQRIETDVKQSWRGNEGRIWVKPTLRTATGFVNPDEFKRRAPDLYFPACKALIEMASDLDDTWDGIEYP